MTSMMSRRSSAESPLPDNGCRGRGHASDTRGLSGKHSKQLACTCPLIQQRRLLSRKLLNQWAEMKQLEV